MSLFNNFTLGKVGENKVLEYYTTNNYNLVAKNFQYYRQGTQGRLGEIDLIFEKNKRLYLVEVKSRNTNTYGNPSSQITKTKLKCLYKTFCYFLSKYPNFREYPCRFDIASVLKNKISIVENAYNFDNFN